MDTSSLSQAAFSAVSPGTPESDRLVAELESTVFHAFMAAVTRAAHEQIEQLNARGHRFEVDPDHGLLAFRAVLPTGSVLTLDLQLAGSASATYLTAEEHARACATAPSPEEARFYRVLDEARTHVARGGLEALTPAERLVFVLGGMEAEINNGGFEQYFLNSAGDHAAEALRMLKRLGARKAARLLAEAMKVFPDGAPADRSRREVMVVDMPPAVCSQWERLSTRYCASAEPIAHLAGEQLA